MQQRQKLILVISILASFVAFLDGSIVNVALPAISRDVGGGLGTQQWLVDAYLLSLGSLILLAGSFSDLFGRKRVLQAGLLGFAISSLLCAIAPNSGFLIAMRAVQGIAGALLVPSSLALIMSSISGPAQGKAIGSWTAWTGIAFIVGPLLGGVLVDSASWRLIFAVNVLPVGACVWLLRHVHELSMKGEARIDVTGSLLCCAGLSGSVFALIEQPTYGWTNTHILIPGILGLFSLAVFVYYESRTKHPMLPLSLFHVRNFSAGNLATVAIYSALSISTFMIIIYLQQVSGYTALEAGIALLPVTIIMFFLSPVFGKQSGNHGPRLFMTLGPMTAALGFLLMLRITPDLNYWTQLLPGVLVFALGLSMTVAPLTSAVLTDIETSRSGIASAVNNAIARIAGLVAIAFVGVIVGPNIDIHGFKHAVLIVAILLFVGGACSWVGIRNKKPALQT